MKKKYKKRIISTLSGILIAMVILFLEKTQVIDIKDYITITDEQALDEDILNPNDTYEVVRVVDGDTFVIEYEGKQEKVRLIGIDTPESVHPDEEKNTEFGDEVSNYSKNILTGKEVLLEFDVEKRDKYGRLLAYVYLDGQMYNKILLEKGYAKIATYPPNVKYVEDFTKLQKEARENKQGLWEYMEVENWTNE